MNVYFIDLYRERARLYSTITHCGSDDEAISEACKLMDDRPHITMAIIDKCTGPGMFRSVATITENLLPMAVILEGETHGL